MIIIVNDIPPNLQWKPCRHLPVLNMCCQMSEPFKVVRPVGDDYGRERDWLIHESATGRLYVVERETFPGCYDPNPVGDV